MYEDIAHLIYWYKSDEMNWPVVSIMNLILKNMKDKIAEDQLSYGMRQALI